MDTKNSILSEMPNDEYLLTRGELKDRFWEKYKEVEKSIKEKAKKSEKVESKDPVIIVYNGIGGIGKTWLVGKLKEYIDEKTLPTNKKPKVVYLDLEKNQDGLAVIKRLKEGLEYYKFTFYSYNKGLKAYSKANWEKGKEINIFIEQNPKTKWLAKVPSELGNIIGAGAAAVLGAATGGVGAAVAGSIIGLAGSIALEPIIKKAGNYIEEQAENRDATYQEELAFFKEKDDAKALEHLFELFIRDVKDNLRKEEEPLIIILDTYEMLVNEMQGAVQPLEADKWLRGGYNFKQGLIPNIDGVLWVIAGREKLKWNKNYNTGKDWNCSSFTFEMKGLPINATKKFLMDKGISNDKLIKYLHSLTDGVPLYLSYCVDKYHDVKKVENREPECEDFGQTTKELTIRYIRKDMDINIQSMLRVLSCLNEWTDEMVEDVIKTRNINYEFYDRVKSLSFIDKNSSSEIYTINRIVRDAILNDVYYDEKTKQNTLEFAIDFCKSKTVELKQPLSSNDSFYIKQLMYYACQYYKDVIELKDFYFNSVHKKLLFLCECSEKGAALTIFEIYYSRIKDAYRKGIIHYKNTKDAYTKDFCEKDNAEIISTKLLFAQTLYYYSYYLNNAGKNLRSIKFSSYALKLFEKLPLSDNESKEIYFRTRIDRISYFLLADDITKADDEAKRLAEDFYIIEDCADSLNADLLFDIYNAIIGVKLCSNDVKSVEAELRGLLDGCLKNSEENALSILLRGNLALALKCQGTYPEAIDEGIKYLEGCKRYFGENDYQTIKAKKILADIYYCDNKLSPFKSLSKEVVSQLPDTPGEGYPDKFDFMNSTAVAYLVLEKYEDALQWLERAAEHGNKHAQYNLGRLYYEGKGVECDYSEAYKLMKKSAEGEDAEPLARIFLGVLYAEGRGVDKNTEEAFKYFTDAAELGNSTAQLNLGLMYMNGLLKEKDLEKALFWVEKAAGQADSDAQTVLAKWYYEGTVVEQDYDEAFKLFEKAAKQGNAEAQYYLGSMFIYGEGTERNAEEGLRWETEAAEQGYAEAQYDLGIRYIHGSDVEQSYVEAFKWFSRAAEQGESDAQYNLGVMYMNGEGVEQDHDKALEWCKKAAEQGESIAQVALGKWYYEGTDGSIDYDIALEWFKKAAEQGNVEAQYYLGVMYHYGRGVEIDYDKAIEWYEKAAEQEYAAAQYYLGVMYYFGRGVEIDYDKAIEWYEKAAEQEDADAQYNLGVMYMNGEGVEQNYVKALEWFKKAAEQGESVAQVALGKWYYEGTDGSIDYDIALEWFKKAAEQGNVEAQYYLGLMHYYGRGVEIDYDKALGWYEIAAEQEDADAQYYLGLMHYYGRGIEIDYDKALEWFKKAAEQGNVEAQYYLGLMHYYGRGVEIDYDKALEWFNIAAEQEDVDAQYYLGLMHYYGRGIEIDYDKALEWFKKAVEQEDAAAQYYLGLMHYYGRGVEIDYDKALEWFKKAAEQGNVDAQCYLGVMYEVGKGVEQNYVKALEWYEKAAEQGEATAQYNIYLMYMNGIGVEKNVEEAVKWAKRAAEQGDEDAINALKTLDDN